jgi:hypothetical protein
MIKILGSLMRKLFKSYTSAVKAFLFVCLAFFLSLSAFAQCTIAGSGTVNWDNASPPNCLGGGNAGSASVIIVPAGMILTFNSNGDTWSGVRIDVYGTLRVSAAGQITINANVEVKNGGILKIDSKLNIGTSDGCGYNLILNNGATADLAGGTSERLNICGHEIARGGTAGCNPYPAGPTPYCEPGGGFTGPVGFDETGVNGTLPVTLLYFNVSPTRDNKVNIHWATATEENANYFSVERSANGIDFTEIGRLNAAGDSQAKREYALVDDQPLIGRSYYRLKEVDFDGRVEHFNMRFIDVHGVKAISVFPNPIHPDEKITLSLNFSNDEKAFVRILDVAGHEIKRFSFAGTESQLPFRPAKGSYIVSVIVGKETFTTRFIIP